MAKGLYKEWLKPDRLALLSAWARDGYTDKDIAGKIGISCSTFYDWKLKHPEFAEAIKKNKEIADYEVETSLFDSARGHVRTLKKPIKVKTVKSKGGMRIEEERIEYVEEQIYIPPNVVAQAMWLKHRERAKWGDDQRATIEAPVINIITGPEPAQGPETGPERAENDAADS